MRINMADSMSGVHDVAGKPKKIANNTFEYHRPDGTKVVRLYRTDILEFRPDGSIVLNSGRWNTVTTKDRLNSYLRDYRVYSERGLWCVSWYKTGETIPFVDGMVLPGAFNGGDPRGWRV